MRVFVLLACSAHCVYAHADEKEADEHGNYHAIASLLLVGNPRLSPLLNFAAHALRIARPRMVDELGAAPQATPPANYNEAEARAKELFQVGEYDRAIRMFELAKTLPGDGRDFKRPTKGSVSPVGGQPNPRGGFRETLFATEAQKMTADYNIACCFAVAGDKSRAMNMLRTYASKVEKPLNEINEMLVDDDLISLRDEIRELREEYRKTAPGLFGLPIPNPFRELAEKNGIEWRD